MAEKKQAPLNKLLTIYFYHTRLTRESYEEWKEYKFPGHILYGLPLLENYGIHSVMHKCKYFSGRLKLMLYATKEILFCKEKYDVLYATSFRGIYNPQIQISAESETKRSIFRKRDKTKRSKKESAQHSKSRNKSFVMTSVSAL